MSNYELKTKIKAEIDVTGKQPLLEGLYIDKWKCEEREEERYGRASKVYDIALRLKYSKEAIKREQERLKREAEEHSRLATRYLADGKGAEEKGQVISAFQSYLSSLRSANIAFDKTSYAAALGRIESLVHRIELSRVIFSVSCKNLGKPADEAIIESKLSSRLVESGQKIVSQDETETVEDLLKDGDFASLKLLCDTIITGEFSTSRGAKLENELFSCFAAGSLKVTDLGLRDTIFQKEVSNVAGFGLDMESAGIDALNKAAELMADYLCGDER